MNYDDNGKTKMKISFKEDYIHTPTWNVRD